MCGGMPQFSSRVTCATIPGWLAAAQRELKFNPDSIIGRITSLSRCCMVVSGDHTLVPNMSIEGLEAAKGSRIIARNATAYAMAN